MQWTLDLPFDKPPLTENQRWPHWAQKAAVIKKVRAAAFWAAKSAGIPTCDRVRVTLTWFVNTRHRRDEDNITPTLKAICDGLVDAGVSDDDTPMFMEKVMPVITYRPGQPAPMQLLIEVIP